MQFLKFIYTQLYKILIQVAKMLLSGIDSLINSNNDATYQSQDANR